MARDLCCDTEIVGAPTVREPDGLALSSRNQGLDAEAREQAVVLVRALDAAESAVAAGERSAGAILAAARAEIAKAPRAEIDYVDLRDPDTLAPARTELTGPTLLAMAVFMRPARGDDAGHTVRLIDNRVLRTQSHGNDRALREQSRGNDRVLREQSHGNDRVLREQSHGRSPS
jgi:pantoate--beta-alanine ligase